MKWTILDLPPAATIHVRLSAYNHGGMSQSVQVFQTESAMNWQGAIDQKQPDSRWGWLRSDPRNLNSPRISETVPMKFGVDIYDGDHTKASTTGEDSYTVYVDHTGYSKMWIAPGQPGRFTASAENATTKFANIAKAARELKGIGGTVRVAYDNGAPYGGGEWGGLSNGSVVTPDTRFEAHWDNAQTGTARVAYPLTYVRIQAADLSKKPKIQNGLNINSSHGSVNGLYFYGFNFHNTGSNSTNVFAPGYATGGMVGFYRCRFDVSVTNASYAGYGIKWHLKFTGCFAIDLRWCEFTAAHEHSGYLNSLGALGAVDSFFIGNVAPLRLAGLNAANVRANGRTGFQTDSRGDWIAVGQSIGHQTGLAPGRGTLWYIGNDISNGTGVGGGSGGKGISLPGHWGKAVVDQHRHLSDLDGIDFGAMNPVQDPGKGAWLNENGFAISEVEFRNVSWQVSGQNATMVICNSTETFRVMQRPGIIMSNRVAFGFSENNPPFPRSVGMVEMSFAGSGDDALRLDPCWPATVSDDKRVRHEFNTNTGGSPPFDSTPAGIANWNAMSRGFCFEAIV